jgi:hypothetical protein
MVLHPPSCLCFCVLLALTLPPTSSCFVFYMQNPSAYCKQWDTFSPLLQAHCMLLDTALRALTDPASLSKDASVSNEHL